MTKIFRPFAALILSLLLWPVCGRAQAVNASQAVVLQGLRATSGHGALRAAAFASDGSLIVLDDEHDSIRLFRSSADGSNVLAQAHVGSTGDSGMVMALDPSGNIYVAGTSSSGTLSGTSGVVYPTPADRSTNSFLAKFDPSLNLVFLTFLGAGRTSVTGVAATTDSAFVTGITYSTTFPVTPGGIQQTPATGSSQNGFVERFNATGTGLIYATYLTGFGGDTTPAAIAADSSDNAYIAGSTTASGYPTIAALQPERFGSPSGFLSKLMPAGNGFVFSTFIAGSGITGLALDASTGSLLLSGSVDLGDFPITAAQSPIAPLGYQTLLRIPEDGQSLTSSVLLVPGTSSFVTPGPNGTAWVSGVLTAPIFPGLTPPLASTGDSFLVHVNTANQIDQTFRVGAQPKNNPSYASLTSLPAAPAVSADGKTAAVPLTLTAIVSASLSASQRFELPLVAAPNALFPSTLRDVATTCASGQCYTTGGLLSEVSTDISTPSFALSADDTPNILLQNLGFATASNIGITATG